MHYVLIGHGYWGKKIHQTLKSLGYKDITVFDKLPILTSEIEIHSVEELENYLQTSSKKQNYFFVVTPEQSHFSLVKKLLKRNQHVFVEKPLSLTKVQAEELIFLAQQNQVNLFVDRIFLYDQGCQLIKNLLLKNKIGEIRRIESIRHSENIHKQNISVFDDLAPHDIYLSYDLLKKHPTTHQMKILQKVENQITEAKLNWNIGEVEWQNWYSWNAHPAKRTFIITGEKGKIIWQKSSPQDLVKITHNTFFSEHISGSVIPSDNEGSGDCPPTDSSPDFVGIRMTKTPQSPSALQLVIQDFFATTKHESQTARNHRYQAYIDEVAVLESIRVQSTSL